MYKIIDLYWERSNLHLIFDKNINDIFIKYGKSSLDIKSNKKEAIITITNTPEGTMLSNGDWLFSSLAGEIVVDDLVITKLEDKSRNFIYRNGLYSYLVNFDIDEKKHLFMKTSFMMINHKPHNFYRFAEASNIIGYVNIFLKKMTIFAFNLFYKIIRAFKLSKNNILFLTENDEKLTGNLKVLYDYLKKNKNYKLKVFASNKYTNNNAKKIKYYLKEIYLIASSNIIFVDNYVSLLTHLNLSSSVKLIQLWHAGVGFKSVGYARFGLDGSPHPYKSCHRKYTTIVVDNTNLIEIYKEVFGTKEHIIKAFGMPRLQGYLDKSTINKIAKKLYDMDSKLKSHKVILFAPTYRGTNNFDAYYDFTTINLEKIYQFCQKEDCIFIFKMHPFIKEKVRIASEYGDKIFDYSNLDINELLYIADILITDYSSCVYEFSLLNRPTIFYRYDRELYEFKRPIHTLKNNNKIIYEAKNFDVLVALLQKLINNVDIEKRFNNIKNIKNDSCKLIEKETMGD